MGASPTRSWCLLISGTALSSRPPADRELGRADLVSFLLAGPKLSGSMGGLPCFIVRSQPRWVRCAMLVLPSSHAANPEAITRSYPFLPASSSAPASRGCVSFQQEGEPLTSVFFGKSRTAQTSASPARKRHLLCC